MNETYKLIQYLRDAQERFFDENHLEGSFWAVDITVHEMDSTFTDSLKKVVDYERK